MARFLKLLVLILVIAVFCVGYAYVSYVKNWNNAETPFDEVGIDLNSYMPGFIQDWGCDQLKAEFGNKTLPPHGCGDATGHGWR